MFISFVEALRRGGIPASLKEHLLLLEALDADVIAAEPEQFYYLARAIFVHDESHARPLRPRFRRSVQGRVSPTMDDPRRSDPRGMAASWSPSSI